MERRAQTAVSELLRRYSRAMHQNSFDLISDDLQTDTGITDLQVSVLSALALVGMLLFFCIAQLLQCRHSVARNATEQPS